MTPRPLPSPQHSDDRLYPPESDAASERGRNDKIRAPAFFAIRDLGSQDIGKAGFAHPRPAHHPFALQAKRRRHNKHMVAALDTAAFEEERYVEDNQRHAPGASLRDKPALGPPHHRVDDPLKPAQRRLVAEHALAETLAIDSASFVAGPGKCRRDRADRRPARPEQPMNLGVGIE